jgi:hypothetical protein
LAIRRLATGPSLYPHVGSDPRKDFSPLGLILADAGLVYKDALVRTHFANKQQLVGTHFAGVLIGNTALVKFHRPIVPNSLCLVRHRVMEHPTLTLD